MFLDFRDHDDYDRDIAPFLRKGIIIDTSVFRIIVDGIVSSKISKKESAELEAVLLFLSKIKMDNKWEKFLITPHILTEICNHIRNKYSKKPKFKEVVEEIMPILKIMKENIVAKSQILPLVDSTYPVLEVADISIRLVTDDFVGRSEKIAILAKDYKLTERYQDSQRVLIMDYTSIYAFV